MLITRTFEVYPLEMIVWDWDEVLGPLLQVWHALSSTLDLPPPHLPQKLCSIELALAERTSWLPQN